MHHWGDEIAGLAEVRRVLSPGGRFLVVERLDPGKPWGTDEAGIDRISGMMRDIGFTDIEWMVRKAGRAEEGVIVGRR